LSGTSSITEENYRLDVAKVANLVSEIAKQRKAGREPILVSSGAIGAGLGRMKLPERPTNTPHLQAVAAIGQGLLMETYEFFFRSYELPTAQVLLTKEDFVDKTRFKNLTNTLTTLLDWGVTPIVNENDTVATEELKVGDNDTLAAYVAEAVDADLLVILTDVDGLYTGNPSTMKGAKFVGIVENVDAKVEGWASKAGKGFGGMYTKVKAAKTLAEKGIPTVITNSSKPDAISQVFESKAGTLFVPRRVQVV